MKSEWINPDDESPKNGTLVNIKDASGTIRKNVLFENGVFWKKQNRFGGGHPWIVKEWSSIEKKKSTKENKPDVYTTETQDV